MLNEHYRQSVVQSDGCGVCGGWLGAADEHKDDNHSLKRLTASVLIQQTDKSSKHNVSREVSV